MQGRRILYVLAGFAVIAVAAGFWYFLPIKNDFSEAATITQNVADFKELSARFEELAKEKGAVYAYGVLLRANIPPNTDMHLLGHTVGDILYTQKGVDGVADCTQDFRNACSHSIVIGALNEFGDGDDTLEMIREACKKAPGGSGAYTMCFHGLGHGVFAFYDYEIPATVDFCERTATEQYHDREYVECIGGTVMELMGGGGHDHEAWVKSREKYLTKDPLAPCSTDYIPDEMKAICYTYLTPHLFERAGADLAMPQKVDIKGAFEFCDEIPKSEVGNRYSCFSGIGKELPLLAVARDTRQINVASDEVLAKMRDLCVAPHEEAYRACTQSIVDSLFWGGENNPDVSIRFCKTADDAHLKPCFEYLFGVALNYTPPPMRADFCARIPENLQESCKKRLLL